MSQNAYGSISFTLLGRMIFVIDVLLRAIAGDTTVTPSLIVRTPFFMVNVPSTAYPFSMQKSFCACVAHEIIQYLSNAPRSIFVTLVGRMILSAPSSSERHHRGSVETPLLILMVVV